MLSVIFVEFLGGCMAKEPNRSTGRTFRDLLFALHSASNGQTVKYVCSDPNQAYAAFVMAFRMCSAIKVVHVNHVITFPNGGTLECIDNCRFKDMSPEEAVGLKIYQDHFVD